MEIIYTNTYTHNTLEIIYANTHVLKRKEGRVGEGGEKEECIEGERWKKKFLLLN